MREAVDVEEHCSHGQRVVVSEEMRLLLLMREAVDVEEHSSLG